MKYKFELLDIETGIITNHKTLQEIREIINIPYHQARSLLLSNDKQFLHPQIKELTKKYKITKLP